MLTVLLMLAEASNATALPMPAFLAGCWEQRTEAKWTEECWTDARGDLMIGSGRTGMDGRIAHWEWMRIERGDDGKLVFFGAPQGASPVDFAAVEADLHSITFVNRSHDYPQRIRYAATEGGIVAEVSLADGTRSNRWHFRRR